MAISHLTERHLLGGTMTARRAVAEMIARGDIAQIGREHILIAQLTTELLDFLASFDAEAEDLEDDDPVGLNDPIDEADEQPL